MLRDPSLIPLSHQHHNGLALCVLTRRALAADPSPANIDRLARRVIDRYELELVNHFEIEEQVLFPVCGPLPRSSNGWWGNTGPSRGWLRDCAGSPRRPCWKSFARCFPVTSAAKRTSSLEENLSAPCRGRSWTRRAAKSSGAWYGFVCKGSYGGNVSPYARKRPHESLFTSNK